jgi:CarD family transcriptional regulator, regulator of rRNA transcription
MHKFQLLCTMRDTGERLCFSNCSRSSRTFSLLAVRHKEIVRMNNDPNQLALVHLLALAGNGEDDELLAFIGRERWTPFQVAERLAHALSLAEKFLRPDDYLRAKLYANTQQDRYRAGDSTTRADSKPRQDDSPSDDRTPRPGSEVSIIDPGKRENIAREEGEAAESKMPIFERQNYKVNEFVVYPAHGVGQILAIEEQEVSGAKLELFVINFVRDKMTLRVPTSKVANVGMRKLSDITAIDEAYRTLALPPQISKAIWSKRAQEYEAKINSGDVVAIAEVVRDLYRPSWVLEQSYSESQLYDAALDRLSREVAVVRRISETEAVKECESLVLASAIQRRTL